MLVFMGKSLQSLDCFFRENLQETIVFSYEILWDFPTFHVRSPEGEICCWEKIPVLVPSMSQKCFRVPLRRLGKWGIGDVTKRLGKETMDINTSSMIITCYYYYTISHY